MIGIFTSLFSALFMARVIFDMMISNNLSVDVG
jgi:preprotein translocase subunit SecD